MIVSHRDDTEGRHDHLPSRTIIVEPDPPPHRRHTDATPRLAAAVAWADRWTDGRSLMNRAKASIHPSIHLSIHAYESSQSISSRAKQLAVSGLEMQ